MSLLARTCQKLRLRTIGTGFFLALPFLFACQDFKSIYPGRVQIEIVTAPGTEATAKPPSFEGPEQDLESLKENRNSLAWIRFPIEATSYSKPTLFLKRCSNVAAVAVGNSVLYRAAVDPKSNFNFANLREPFISLPSSDLNHMAMLLKSSLRTGLAPDCADLLLSDETSVIRYFSASDLPEIVIGFVLLVLIGITLATYFKQGDPLFLSSSLFYLGLAGTFIFGNQLVHFVHSNNKEIYCVASFSLLSAPIFYMLFIYQLLDKKYATLIRLMAADSIFALITFTFIILDFETVSTVLERLYLSFIALQSIALIPIIAWHYKYAQNKARRSFWIGFFILTLGLWIDAVAYATSGAGVHAAALGTFLYLFLAISTLARKLFANLSQEHTQNRSDAEEFSARLQGEVELREASLREKNRLFEESNSELEEKNILLRLSYKRLDDLLHTQSTLLRKAAQIRNTVIPELEDSRLALLRSESDRSGVKRLSLSLHRLSSSLDSFQKFHEEPEAEEGLTGRTVWIVTQNPETDVAYRAALGSSKIELQTFRDRDTLLSELTVALPNLLLISSSFEDLITMIHNQYPSIQVVIFGDREMAKAIDFLTGHTRLNHLVIEPSLKNQPLMQKNLLTTTTKILSGDIFGIEKYLHWGVDIKEAIISGNKTRSEALVQLENELTKSGLSSTLIRKAHHLADELLMNAIYDAPVDKASNRPRYNHLDRAINVELEPSEYARLRYGYDGMHLALSIDDPFGALPREVILKYLKSCFQGEFGRINQEEGKGGGGMGLYQIMTSADLLVTNITPGNKTEIIAILDVHEKAGSKGLCFHYFIEP
ncbi:MAG: hypothetical protein H7249_12550 [Chitinophagaceae bacterium]|nr:hypothetical protein [Oligoflexus sp.]